MADDGVNDPLMGLWESEEALSQERRASLARILKPFVKLYIDKGVPEVALTEEGIKLTAREKILTYLLARKAISLTKSDLLPEEGISPSELEKKLEIPGGTIRPILTKLREERLVKSNDREYLVPNHAISKIAEILSKKGE